MTNKTTLHSPRLGMTLHLHKCLCASEMLGTTSPAQCQGGPEHLKAKPQSVSPDSSTLASAILSHSRLEEPAYSWPSAVPELLSLHRPVTQHPELTRLPVGISITHHPFHSIPFHISIPHTSMHQVPQEHVQEGQSLGTAQLAHFN